MKQSSPLQRITKIIKVFGIIWICVYNASQYFQAFSQLIGFLQNMPKLLSALAFPGASFASGTLSQVPLSSLTTEFC